MAIGKKGCGKTEWSLGILLDFARTPCYVVAHDLGWKIPDTLHDGRPTHVIRVSSAEEAREGMKAGKHGIYAISSEDALEVLHLAQEVAEASLEQHGGDKGVPCFFYCDEVVSAGLMDPNHIDPEFRRAMAEARHRHIGILVGVQSARMLHNTLLTLATHAQLFQITDAEDHKRLIRVGIAPEAAMRTAKLPPHESFGVKL